jgi:hypothetical protein
MELPKANMAGCTQSIQFGVNIGIKLEKGERKEMKRILLLVAACLISLSLVLASCSKTVTFEQKRADVVTYLRAFNGVENDFDSASSQVVFPSSVITAADLITMIDGVRLWDTAVTKLLTVIDGAISRLAELKPSSLETSTSTHLQQARSFYQSYRTTLKALQDAVAANIVKSYIDPKNEAVIVQKFNELTATDASASSLNRATEQLMLQYNISDSEVSYRFRGK